MLEIVSELESRSPDYSIVGDLDAHKIEISVTSNSGGDLFRDYQFHTDMTFGLHYSKPIIPQSIRCFSPVYRLSRD